MEISGPSLVLVKNGKPFNKYEVSTRVRTPKGVKTDLYWFNKQKDAELYIEYLVQVRGLQEMEETLRSKRTYLWEKQELLEFRETLDLTTLPEKVKKLKFTHESVFVETRFGQQ